MRMPQDAAQRAEQQWRRLMREASSEHHTLDCMGLLQADQDNWRTVVALGRWLKMSNSVRFGEKRRARLASWFALTDALLHHNAVDALVPFVEAKAQVWLSTVDSTHKVRHARAWWVRRPVDAVILDEAGSMPEWKMPLLTRFQPRLLLSVGDHKQLPPFTNCRNFRPVSVLQRLSDTLAATRKPVKMLDTQYRMHPDICRVVSKHFYGGRLWTAPSRAQAVAHNSVAPIVWRTHQGSEDRPEHSRSWQNREEARIICKEMLPALAADAQSEGKKVVVITLYKAQLRLLEEMLAEHGMAEHVAVMTVDAAQGSEADIVILSLVRSNDRRELGHATERHRINVALSRARDRLLVVGNDACFRRHGVWGDLWRRAVQRRAVQP